VCQREPRIGYRVLSRVAQDDMRRRLVALNIAIPVSIAATNNNVRVLPKPMEASAGPGQ
jgi:hypothetical protein